MLPSSVEGRSDAQISWPTWQHACAAVARRTLAFLDFVMVRAICGAILLKLPAFLMVLAANCLG